MTLIYIKILHLVGAFCLFLGFGGLLAVGENRTHINRIVASLHGVGLLALFLTGFAMMGMDKSINGFPAWLIIKIMLWIGMVLLFVFTKRGKIPAKVSVFVSLLVGAIAAFLCLTWRLG